jgi:hypothetical protein
VLLNNKSLNPTQGRTVSFAPRHSKIENPMKSIYFKSVLVIAFLALFANNTFAQKGGLPLVPLYLEHYNQRTEKLESKMWNNERHIRIESIVDGKTEVMIYRSDSARAYMVDDAKKTLTVFPAKQLVKTFDVKSTDEFIGKETVEGLECEHYRTKITETLPNGQVRASFRDSWWYEPYKTEIKSKEEGLDVMISRNIRVGAQPASLFELPKGYKVVNMQEQLNDINKLLESMQKPQNPQGGKTPQDANQQMQDALKMLEGLNKK